MSATARARTREAQPRKIPGGFTKIGQFILLGLAREIGSTPSVIYGCVLDQARVRRRQWVEVSPEFLGTCANVTPRFAEQGLAELVAAGLLKRQVGPVHMIGGKPTRGWEYKDALPPQKKAKRGDELLVGHCTHCGVDGVMERHAGYCPVPTSYWTKLPACVQNSTHRLVGVIMAHTMGWNQWSAVLTHEELMRDSGLARRTVIEAIAEGMEKGVIGRTVHGPGEGSMSNCIEYWVNIEQFGKLQRIPPKTLEVCAGGRARPDHAGGEETAAPEAAPDAPSVGQPAKSRAAEYVTTPITRCRNCGQVGPHKLIETPSAGSESHFPGRTDSGTGNRGGPSPTESPARRPETQAVPEIAAELRPLDAFLRSLGLRQNPGPAYVAAIWADLQGEALETFAAECHGARRRILTAETSQAGVLRAIARGVGKARLDREEANAAVDAELDARDVALLRTMSLEEARDWLARPALDERSRRLLLVAFPELKP